MPANIGSSAVKIRFALNPPETPANAAARPAKGCLPNPAKITAPSGGKTTYPASEATLDMTPAKTNAEVMSDLGIDSTKPRKIELTKPDITAITITKLYN